MSEEWHPEKTICNCWPLVWYECPHCGERIHVPRHDGDTVYCLRCEKDVNPILRDAEAPSMGYGRR